MTRLPSVCGHALQGEEGPRLQRTQDGDHVPVGGHRLAWSATSAAPGPGLNGRGSAVARGIWRDPIRSEGAAILTAQRGSS